MIAVEKRRVRTSGGELAYVDEGEGPAVLLLHGFPLSSILWRDLVPLLSTRFRAIAPDILGAGDSDHPDDVPLDLSAQAKYVRELLAELGVESFAVVGHGHGGGIAQLLALDGSGVEAMVLLDSVAFDLWPAEGTRELQRGAIQHENEGAVHTLLRTDFDLGMGRRSRLPDEVLGEYLRPWSGPEGAQAYFRAVRSMDGVGLAGRERDIARFEFPVLILWGEDDAFFPVAIAERLSEAMPTSTLGLLPGCGHLVVEDAPETIAPMVYEYLRARYLKAPHGHEGIVGIQLERKPAWIEEDE